MHAIVIAHFCRISAEPAACALLSIQISESLRIGEEKGGKYLREKHGHGTGSCSAGCTAPAKQRVVGHTARIGLPASLLSTPTSSSWYSSAKTSG